MNLDNFPFYELAEKSGSLEELIESILLAIVKGRKDYNINEEHKIVDRIIKLYEEAGVIVRDKIKCHIFVTYNDYLVDIRERNRVGGYYVLFSFIVNGDKITKQDTMGNKVIEMKILDLCPHLASRIGKENELR